MAKREIVIGSAVLLLALAACTKEDTQQSSSSTHTQREKDSILAGSQIPGAKAVKKTMTVADSAAARQARIDTSQQNP